MVRLRILKVRRSRRIVLALQRQGSDSGRAARSDLALLVQRIGPPRPPSLTVEERDGDGAALYELLVSSGQSEAADHYSGSA